MSMNPEMPFEELYQSLKTGTSLFPIKQVRDLTQIELGNGFSLVIAVDSDGGIGSLPADVVKCSDHLLGRFAIRVPLMEIIACGAWPLAAFDMLTLPMHPHGKKIIEGIRTELAEAGLGTNFPLSGSTEDNVPTSMTGIGTLVLGLVKEEDFRPGKSHVGDQVLCLGLPKSGPVDVICLEDKEIIKVSELKTIMRVEGIHDVLPVGSRGVLYEARQMASLAQMNFIPVNQSAVDLHKSACPSTCVLVSCQPEAELKLLKLLELPIINVGYLAHA